MERKEKFIFYPLSFIIYILTIYLLKSIFYLGFYLLNPPDLGYAHVLSKILNPEYMLGGWSEAIAIPLIIFVFLVAFINENEETKIKGWKKGAIIGGGVIIVFCILIIGLTIYEATTNTGGEAWYMFGFAIVAVFFVPAMLAALIIGAIMGLILRKITNSSYNINRGLKIGAFLGFVASLIYILPTLWERYKYIKYLHSIEKWPRYGGESTLSFLFDLSFSECSTALIFLLSTAILGLLVSLYLSKREKKERDSPS